MSRVFQFLLLTTLFVIACNPKDPDPTPADDPYESCCGSAPVAFVHGAGEIYIPNVITANGDGISDVFYPFVNGHIIKVEDMVITDGDGVVLYEQALLNLANPAATGWFGLKPDNTYHKGLFNYKMSFLNDSGASKTIAGSACCIVCDSAAVVFKTKTGCYYPIQYDDLSGFNPAAPTFEADCFEH
jgi:hypothetical protein